MRDPSLTPTYHTLLFSRQKPEIPISEPLKKTIEKERRDEIIEIL
jgi:hypothetical protein